MTEEGGEQLPVHELRFSSLRELKENLLPCLSSEGLFIPCAEPAPTSSVLRFRLLLPDRFVLAEGTGVVVWSRPASPGSELDPGMGVRYVVLPEASRAVIEQLVEEHLAAGGQAFDVDHLPGDEPVDDEDRAAEAGEPPVRLERERIRLTVRADTRLGGAGGTSRPSAATGEERAGASEDGVAITVRPPAPEPAGAGPEPVGSGGRRSAEASDDELMRALRGRRPVSFWLQAAAILVVGAVAAGAVLWLFGRSAGEQERTFAQPGPVAAATASRAAEPEAEPDLAATSSHAGVPTPPASTSGVDQAPRSGPPPEPRANPEEPRLVGITWGLGDGATLVILELAGGLEAEGIEVSPMLSPPRVLVRLRGVQLPFPQYRLAVGSPEVSQVRTWLHDELDPPELHVVLDLTGNEVRVLASETRPGALTLRLGR